MERYSSDAFKSVSDLIKAMSPLPGLAIPDFPAQMRAAILPNPFEGISSAFKVTRSAEMAELVNRITQFTSPGLASALTNRAFATMIPEPASLTELSKTFSGLYGDFAGVGPLVRDMTKGFAVPKEVMDRIAVVEKALATIDFALREDAADDEEPGESAPQAMGGAGTVGAGVYTTMEPPLTRQEWLEYVAFQRETLDFIKSMVKPKKVALITLLFIVVFKLGDIMDFIGNSMSLWERFAQHETAVTPQDLDRWKKEMIDTIQRVHSADSAKLQHQKVYFPKLYNENRYTRLKTKVMLKPKKGSQVLLWIPAGREVTMREIKGTWAQVSYMDESDSTVVYGWVMKKNLSAKALKD